MVKNAGLLVGLLTLSLGMFNGCATQRGEIGEEDQGIYGERPVGTEEGIYREEEGGAVEGAGGYGEREEE